MVGVRRISNSNIKVIGGGNQTNVIGSLNWGPDFGDSGSEFKANGSLFMPSLAIQSSQTLNVTGTIKNIDWNFRSGTSFLNPQGSVFIPTVGLTASGQKCQISTTFLDFATGSIISGKDTWVDSVAACTSNGSHNATDLQIDSTVATSKDTYIAWDLSVLSGATVIESAVFTINRKTVPLLTAWVANIFGISNGSETWSEASLTCSTRPASSGAILGSIAGAANTTGELRTTLGPVAGSRILDRAGSGICTFLLQMSSAVSAATFQSKDSGGIPGNAQGPKLEITFRTI